MDLQERDRKEPPESVIPMINVVFLLLIFFLMAATLSPPADATPPVSALAGERADRAELIIGADGVVRFGALAGDDAIGAAAQGFDQAGADPLAVLADAAAPGSALARTTRRLAALGVPRVALTALRGGRASDCAPGASEAETRC